jgi:hypothetical protein
MSLWVGQEIMEQFLLLGNFNPIFLLTEILKLFKNAIKISI